MIAHRPDGVVFREAAFTPAFGTHAGERCVGVQVHITDRHHLDPILVATTMLVGLRAGYREFGWRADEPDDHPGRWMDLLTGLSRFREQLEAGAGVEDIVAGWPDEQAGFDRRRRPVLLYPGEPV